MRFYEYERKYILEKIKNVQKRIEKLKANNAGFYQIEKARRELECLLTIKKIIDLQGGLLRDTLSE